MKPRWSKQQPRRKWVSTPIRSLLHFPSLMIPFIPTHSGRWSHCLFCSGAAYEGL